MTLPVDPDNVARNGKKGRKASPWHRGPMCATKKAGRSFVQYVKKGAPPTRNRP